MNNNQTWWIQYHNGYTASECRAALNMLGNMAAESPYSPTAERHLALNNYICDTVTIESRADAEMNFRLMVGYLEGVVLGMNDDTNVEFILYRYLMNAARLATLVPYADRLDD